ncbi:TetR family transcriptional regulator [Murinocardiopsis flavida]|uniref:TetR family transcriptional regulator n=1 Tax=Murinocardiopsis flavida TaxID=645275 RepID=A0A2P8CJ79_9ACTN|nr:TetR/AcrR family transcriptional regulator [Murinocardiopsis flavida]PSK85021.1 TetR family transcriptional regulator [Murinocardiopsis flavida]
MNYLPADERRRTIIDAAVDVIAAEGLARATTRRIAEKAGAPLGALHYCFRNKNELNMLILERGQATMQATFAHIDPAAGFEATLRASVATYWRWIRENPGLHFALMELLMWFIRNKETIAPTLRDGDMWVAVNAPMGGALIQRNLDAAARADGTAPAIAVHEITRFLIHRMDGLVFEFAETKDEESCERQAELLADALVHLSTRYSPAAGEHSP